MGLGLSRPELLLIPVTLILIWVAIDIAAVFFGMWLVDRSKQRRSVSLRLFRRRQRKAAPPVPDVAPQPLQVCQWCNGTGKLEPTYATALKLAPLADGRLHDCPECKGFGYFDGTADRRDIEAYREKLLEQEWKQ